MGVFICVQQIFVSEFIPQKHALILLTEKVYSLRFCSYSEFFRRIFMRYVKAPHPSLNLAVA